MIDKESLKGRAGVYFVQCREFVKIGFSTDICGRFCTVSNGVRPFVAHIVDFIPDRPELWQHEECPYSQEGFLRTLERRLHIHFEDKRAEGEWFRLTPEDIAEAKVLGTKHCDDMAFKLHREKELYQLSKIKSARRLDKKMGLDTWDPILLGA